MAREAMSAMEAHKLGQQLVTEGKTFDEAAKEVLRAGGVASARSPGKTLKMHSVGNIIRYGVSGKPLTPKRKAKVKGMRADTLKGAIQAVLALPNAIASDTQKLEMITRVTR